MPLVSRLFQNNQKLQACLTSDPDHITSGSRGDHVTLVQTALMRLRVLDAEDGLAETGVYGPQTAKAVLRYKERLNIINPTYQNRADNIVGKMTIAHLDESMVALDRAGALLVASWPGEHVRDNVVLSKFSVSNAFGLTTTNSFSPPLSDLPSAIQDLVRRNNESKVPGELVLFPFIAKHEGPLSDKKLSERFAKEADSAKILSRLYTRMFRFSLWGNIKRILSVYKGSGADGIHCEVFDHDSFLRRMEQLTKYHVLDPMEPRPLLRQFPFPGRTIAPPLFIAAEFCKDLESLNLHDQRDCFREMVTSGPGLHICITQKGFRDTLACDLHIDTIQTGSLCLHDGTCAPLLNEQTLGHLETVRPYLEEQAAKRFWGLVSNKKFKRKNY